MEAWLNVAAVFVIITYVFTLYAPRRRHLELWLAFAGPVITYLCFFRSSDTSQQAAFGFAMAFSLLYYWLLVFWQDFGGRYSAVFAMAGPILVLAALKLDQINFIIGFSYLALRLAYLAYEIHTQRVKLPNLSSYMGFVFFPLTFLIGPISPYRLYEESLAGHYRSPAARCLGRILVGILKCYMFAQLFKTLSFFTYWQPLYHHTFGDFTLSAIATALYIYFNFSGACDIMIGAAALMGIQVQENFNNPFLSRNLAEYWTRNHITLTQVVRDLIFTPSLLYFARLSHGRFMGGITVLCTLSAFFIVGVWHGSELGFMLFGLMHGIGVVAVNIYGRILRGMPKSVQNASASIIGRALSTALTFMYVAYSSVFFGSSKETLLSIWSMLRPIS